MMAIMLKCEFGCFVKGWLASTHASGTGKEA